MKKVERMIRLHKDLILNWFKAKGRLSKPVKLGETGRLSSGIVDGLTNKAKVTVRIAYGFRNPEAQKIALLHLLGKLPEPKLTHRFY